MKASLKRFRVWGLRFRGWGLGIRASVSAFEPGA